MTAIDTSQHVSHLITEPQHQFVTLLKEITHLQWVRESLPIQSKYYQDLKEQHERETHLKGLLEKQIQEHRKKQDTTFTGLLILKRSTSSFDNKTEPSYSELIERLRRCDGKRKDIETQLRSAETMLQHFNSNKHTLDTHCLTLHTLYDKTVPDLPDDPAHVIERHLKSEVLQLANDIPQIEKDITSHSGAQKKLYESRDLMEKAMMTLPGATTFLDRQALAGHKTNGSHSLFMKSSALSSMLDVTVPTLKDAEKLASEAYKLERHASKLCKDVPLIPNSSFNRVDNVMTVLTAYRGYRLKIETVLRTQVNPRLSKLQCQLAITKYHLEQKTMEWIEQQIIILEHHLRRRGCLRNVNLDREIEMLRMGSTTAAAESNGRMTVDNALDVTRSTTTTERNGDLPAYSANASSCDGDSTTQPFGFMSFSLSSSPSSSSSSSNNNNTSAMPSSSSSSSPAGSASPLVITSNHSIPTTSTLSLENTSISSSSSSSFYHLPAYSEHRRLEYLGPEAPPAYSR
ncbi:unnamed protein product [Absidia cylindrospora]